MKKKKLNQRRYRQGEVLEKRPVSIETQAPDEILLEHLREMVSLIEGREITREEALELVRSEREKRETTPP